MSKPLKNNHAKSVNRRPRNRRRKTRDSNKFSKPTPNHQSRTSSNTTTLMDVLDSSSLRYCEAVTNPFGNDAIGALLPDRYQELVIPCYDRIEFDLSHLDCVAPGMEDWPTHTFANNAGASVQCTGIITWFQPRCHSTGLTVTNGGDPTSQPKYPFTVTGSFSEDADAKEEAPTYKDIINQQYVLCYTGLWRVSSGDIQFLPDGRSVDTGGVPFTGTVAGILTSKFNDGYEYPLPYGYKVVEYPRIQQIAVNSSKGRILGAGLKAWSEEAPINTGGFCVGGWMTNLELLQMTGFNEACPTAPINGTNLIRNAYWTPGDVLARNALFASTLITRIKGPCRQAGIKGVTTRYSPLQTPEQIEAQPITLPADSVIAAEYDASDPEAYGWGAIPYANLPIETPLTSMDVVSNGTYLPVIVWKYNLASSATSETDSLYTLRIMSVVHTETQPNGNSPFMSMHADVDPSINKVKMLLENWETFPPAVSGHSFTSFIKKVRHVALKFGKGLSKTHKIVGLVDKFLGHLTDL